MTVPFGQVDQLQPPDIAAYLAVSGWQLEQQRGPAAEVWRLQSSAVRPTRLLLPRDPEYADYGARLDDALKLLRALHEFTPEQLALRVAQTRADVLYVRADQSMMDGTIPLKQAENLVVGARKMLAAAASSTVKPRAKIAGRRSQAVIDFLNDDLRMGHTQRGSFVITVLTRLDEPEVVDISPQDVQTVDQQPPGAPGDTSEVSSAAPDDDGDHRSESAVTQVVVPSFQLVSTAGDEHVEHRAAGSFSSDLRPVSSWPDRRDHARCQRRSVRRPSRYDVLRGPAHLGPVFRLGSRRAASCRP